MNPSHQISAHGSGPSTARGRFALMRALEPSIPAWCQRMRLGQPKAIDRVLTGTHHIVWKVHTERGVFAIRPAALATPKMLREHGDRERLWKFVTSTKVGARYRGSCPFKSTGFRGRIEVFDWIDGRHLRAESDYRAVATALAKLHARRVAALHDRARVVEPVEFIRSRLGRYSRLNRSISSSANVLATPTLDALEDVRRLGPWKGKYRLVHNDLVDANVIVKGHVAHFIDWDWAVISSPLIDLFNFLSPFVRSWGQDEVFVPRRATRGFVRTYFQATNTKGQTRSLHAGLVLWRPYNVLLANWLEHDAPATKHVRRREFFARALNHANLQYEWLLDLK